MFQQTLCVSLHLPEADSIPFFVLSKISLWPKQQK